MKKTCIYLICVACCMVAVAQQVVPVSATGEIVGVVQDHAGESLPGVNIWIPELEKGISTDINGHFQLKKIPVGTYSLRISYISYQTQLRKVQVQAGVATQVNIDLLSTSTELSGVEIKTERTRDNALAMLDLRRKSVHLLEGLSVAQMKRFGDNDVGQAMRRMTGVTVEEGQYVYVRGLSDRYNRTVLNGASIPGLDPNRNSTQMDIFPVHLIDNVVVYKTFSAELPGDFVGGYINIETKSIPETATIHLSSSTSYNANANLNDSYLTYTGGRVNWLATGRGVQKIPDILTQGDPIPSLSAAEQNTTDAAYLQSVTQAFGTQDMNIHRQAMPLNHRVLASLGDRYLLFGNPLGYMLTLSHQRAFDAYQSGLSHIYKQRGIQSHTLAPLLALDDAKSTEHVLWGALLGLGYKPPGHDIRLNLMHTQKGNVTTRRQTGTKPEDDPDLHYFTQGLWYTQKSISTLQLKGTHEASQNKLLEVGWVAAYTLSRIYQPNLRFFTYGHYTPQADGGLYYLIQPSLGQVPTRYFRDLQEQLADMQLNLKHNIGHATSKALLKGGGAVNVKSRTFREAQYRYNSPQVATVPNGKPNDYIAAKNTWQSDRPTGTYITDASLMANNYDANQLIWAGYVLWEQPLPDNLHLSTGLRYEGTQLRVISADPSKPQGQLLLHDLLPSFKLTHRQNERLTYRAAYGRTLARPSFRELAPFASFDFIGDYILVGNPLLERTSINNVDLSAEYYPTQGEMLSVGLFYKHFQKPIERTFNIQATNPELTFRNVPESQAMGVEIGIKKQLSKEHPLFRAFSVGTNVALIHTWVDIDPEEFALIKAYNAQASPKREMYGQAPYVLNAYLSYDGKKGWKGTLGYNTLGKRISVITPGGPSTYELPRHNMDISISKIIARTWKLRLSARNLLDAPFRFVQDFNQTTYFAQRYRTGRQLSVSLAYSAE